MKKFFFSLLLLIASIGAINAQSSMLATLIHEGKVTVFYGANALKEAHAAAAHGDAITLSSGSFSATNITKAITLRGAGMETDSLKNIYPTIVSGNFNIAIGDTITQKLTMEGIYHDYQITIKNGLNNASFIKNKLNTIHFTAASTDTAHYQNNRFIHCKITNYFFAPKYSKHKSFSFINSYIHSLMNNASTMVLTNCIIFNNYYNYTFDGVSCSAHLNSLTYCNFNNCILIGYIGNTNSCNKLSSTCTAYNCIATNINSENLIDDRSYTFGEIPNSTNSCIQSMSNVFKTFTGTYKYSETFELKDDVKTKYLGNDGKEIGIHGGSLPYSSTPSNPQITKCNVASRSTADGKLSIDIEVRAGE